MTNAFDSSSYPTTEPNTFNAGDRWAWVRSDLSEYGTGFTLRYRARLGTDGTTTFTFDATWDGTKYVVEVASATTAGYTAGDYSVEIYMVRDSDSERVSLGDRIWTVQPNLSTSTADTRSHAKRVLDSIEAVIEGRASDSQESYQIKDRALKYMTHEELLKLRSFYKAEYKREQDALLLEQGLGSSRKVHTRFGSI